MGCVIHWFRNDLRLSDNPAFTAACHEAIGRGIPLLPVFVHDPAQTQPSRWGMPRTGPHRQAWLADTLAALDTQLQALGSRLLLLHGPTAETLSSLLQAVQAVAVHAEDIPAPEEATQARRVSEVAQDAGGHLHLHWQSTLLPLDALPVAWTSGHPHVPDVFTQFRQGVEQAGVAHRTPLPAPSTLPAVPTQPGLWEPQPSPGTSSRPPSDTRSSFPAHLAAFSAGELGAQAHLEQYLARRLPHSYKNTRNQLAGVDFSSKFSPWLATGALSAAQVVQALRAFEDQHGANDGTYWLWFELLWRDHFRLLHLKHGTALYRARGLSNRPVPPHNPGAFESWCLGRTGEPLVDAGMRELAATGWISNRMRQVVASHLVNELACDWRAGAAWFEHTLIDFDVHSNQGNWLYVAGRGTDPRGGRRFNPEKQARDHDPHGDHCRLWGTA